MSEFDINKFLNKSDSTSRYNKRIEHLKVNGSETEHIENTVSTAIDNIVNDKAKSFVIYGEPQSGKTEMMIALTAKLLDLDFKIIVLLLNDSVSLLNQNLERFSRSGITPAPRNFSEIMAPNINIHGSEWIIFSKKNSKDLQKLLRKLDGHKNVVVIDDEADYATPNSKINRGEQTKINELVGELLSDDGIYIGVTATPARLDLNNTFKNNSDLWTNFKPHSKYIGHEIFFPLEGITNGVFSLNLLPDQGDEPKHLRYALFSFFVNVAYLNLFINEKENNYSILIHTSGRKADHTEDHNCIEKTISCLRDKSEKSNQYIKEIWDKSKKRYPGNEDMITNYIMENIKRYRVVVMNSDKEKNAADNRHATIPSTLFTIAIGGNIVSRGVTFENLLSMFFTRDVKHKLQQDTYIQRARMFGPRGAYLKYFELTIPNNLYFDWHKCFIFHRLALESIQIGNGSPVWLENRRIASVASSSIDRSTVSLDKGEMSYELFKYNSEVDGIINSSRNEVDKLTVLADKLGNNALPPYLLSYIIKFSNNEDSLAIHPSSSISGYKSSDADIVNIKRSRGFMGNAQLERNKYPNAIHHIKIFYNDDNNARLFYKYEGNIRFLKNFKGNIN